MANGLIDHDCVMKPPWKPQRVGSDSSGWTCGRFGREVSLGYGSPEAFPHTSPWAFYLAVPEFYPCIINWSSSKQNISLSSVSHYNKLTESEERVVGTSDIWAVSQSTGDIWTHYCCPKWRKLLEPPNCSWSVRSPGDSFWGGEGGSLVGLNSYPRNLSWVIGSTPSWWWSIASNTKLVSGPTTPKRIWPLVTTSVATTLTSKSPPVAVF